VEHQHFRSADPFIMRSLPSNPVGRPFHVLLRRSVCAAALVLTAAACKDSTGSGERGPAITHLAPGKLLQSGAPEVLTVTGSGFVDGSVVHVNGTPELTAFVSASQLVTEVSVAHMQQAGTLQITVVNPRGKASDAMALPVEHRVPDLLFLDPSGREQGSAAFTVTLFGNGFSRASVVRWNGSDRPTTFVSFGRLTVQVSASDLEQAGTPEVTVFNPPPGGGTSVARVFTVSARPNPVAVVATLSPNAIAAGTGADFTLTGTGFMAGSQVWVGGFTPTTTFVSPTELRFTLTGGNLPTGGFASVYVANPAPGGGPSNSVSLRVDNPLPVLTALSPAQAVAGADSLVVRLTGTGFVPGGDFMPGTSVRVDGSYRAARHISPTELEIVLTADEVSEVRTLKLQAVNAPPAGGTSNTLTLSVGYPAPVVSGITPAQALAGADSLVVRVSGTNFVPLTVGRIGGAARPTRYVSPTALDVVLGPADLDAAGTFAITAATPAPGGGTSAAATLTLTAPSPALALLPSSGASAGRAGFVLTLHGSGFVRASVVRWNGQERETRFISGTRLEATIPASDVAAPGTASVTVHTPGAGTSAARQMTIRAVGPATITDSMTIPLPVRDLVYDPRTDRIYASMGASPEGEHGSTVVAINPHTGAITDSVVVGEGAGELALSDDGSALWVAVDGAGLVRRISLPAFTLGMSFSTGEERVDDMAVMPGRPGTVVIALMRLCCTPRHAGVAVYDNGVQRPRTTSEHAGSSVIAFGESASVLYGQGEYGGFWTMEVDGEGVSVVRATGLSSTGYHLQYANGRVYNSTGGVIDAARHQLVGSVAGGQYSVAVDASLGRAFYANAESGVVRVYDLNTFQLLGQVDVEDGFTWTLIRWGTDGLALAGVNSTLRIFRTPLAGP
jgi:hypothetical protein